MDACGCRTVLLHWLRTGATTLASGRPHRRQTPPLPPCSRGPTAAGRRRFRVTRLPRFLVLHVRRFLKNQFFMEKNPTIVNFPVKSLELAAALPVPKGEPWGWAAGVGARQLAGWAGLVDLNMPWLGQPPSSPAPGFPLPRLPAAAQARMGRRLPASTTWPPTLCTRARRGRGRGCTASTSNARCVHPREGEKRGRVGMRAWDGMGWDVHA